MDVYSTQTFSLNDIETHIVEYVNATDHKYAISVEGRWGTGKTYFFEHRIREKLNEHNKKLIRVSLFGVSSVEEAQNRLTSALLQRNANGDTSRVHQVNKKLLSRLTSSIEIPLNAVSMTFALPMHILTDLLTIYALNDGIVIVFDDIERRSTSGAADTNLFGMINDLVESHGIKVIFIMNSDKEQTSSSFDKDIREKLIWKSYPFTPTYADLIHTVFSEPLKGAFDIHKSLITAAERAHCDSFRAILRSKEFIVKLSSLPSMQNQILHTKIKLGFTDIVSYAFFNVQKKDKKLLEEQPTSIGESLAKQFFQSREEIAIGHIDIKKFNSFSSLFPPIDLHTPYTEATLEDSFNAYINEWYNLSEETYLLFKIVDTFKYSHGYTLSDDEARKLSSDLSNIIASHAINIQYIVDAIELNRFLRSLGEPNALTDAQLLAESYETLMNQDPLHSYEILDNKCSSIINERDSEFLEQLKHKVAQNLSRTILEENFINFLDIWATMPILHSESEWRTVLLSVATPDRFITVWKHSNAEQQEKLRRKLVTVISRLQGRQYNPEEKDKINHWAHSLLDSLEAITPVTGTFSIARHNALRTVIENLSLQ